MKKIHNHSKSQTSFLVSTLPSFSAATPKEHLDFRCEYEVPRFFDLTQELNSEPILQEDQRLDEEFFKWFQIAHDFKVNKKQIQIPKEIYQQLPPRQELGKIGSVNSKMQKQANIEYKGQQNKTIKQQLQEKLNGSQTDRNLNIGKSKGSRNILNKNSSSTLQNTLHRLKGNQKSFDATNCNLFQKLTALNQQSHLAQLSSKTQEKGEKIILDLTPHQPNQQIKFTNNPDKLQSAPGNKTSREAKVHHQRLGSNNSRKDFISRNKDIVKLLSARSKERKTSSQIGMVEDLVDTPKCEILLHPKIKEPSLNSQIQNLTQKNHFPPSHSKQNSSKGLLTKEECKSFNFQSFLGGSTGGSGSNQPKKKNGRVNSQLQFKSISNTNLMKSSMMEAYKNTDEEGVSTGNTSKKQTIHPDQENSNAYIRQLLMMQEKYQQQRTRHRNQGIGSSLGGSGKLSTQLSEKFGVGMFGGGTLQNFKDFHNQKQLPTKKSGSSKIVMIQNTTREKRKREPLVSQITLENL